MERAVSGREIKATKAGEARVVDLTSRMVEALSRWQAAVEAEALTAEDEADLEPSPWVFPSEASTPLDEARVAKRFWALLAAAKLPRFRLYDLRNTFATHLLAEGAPITYVAAHLGHAKPTTTLAFYAHWLPRGDKGLIDRLEAVRCRALAQGGRKKSERTEGVVASSGDVGSPGRTRTCDLVINSHPLYRLSYRGVFAELQHAAGDAPSS